MSKTTLELVQTDSEFLDKAANKITINGEEWYYLPFWFHKVADGKFLKYPFKDIPDHVREFINTERSFLPLI